MQREFAIQSIEASAIGIAGVAVQSPGAAIPRYPGHDVADLVRHVITIHEWVTRMVDELSDAPLTQVPPDSDLAGAALLDRYERAWRSLIEVLGTADSAAPVWTFGVDQTVSFWLQRMAHTTPIPRWDAESAVGEPNPLPPGIALSGLREGLHIHCFRPLRKVEVGGSGEQIAIAPTDADESWTITLNSVGIEVEPGATASAVASIAGTAAELWLALGRRIPFERLGADGDVEAIARFERAIDLIPSAL